MFASFLRIVFFFFRLAFSVRTRIRADWDVPPRRV
jgi:hypothetical protein